MIYLDTSFLVSLYSFDAHSTHAAQIRRANPAPMLLSTLSEFEMINALWVLVFRGQIATHQAVQSELAYDVDLRAGHFNQVSLPESSFVRANELSRKLSVHLGTRAVDVLHIAAALELGASGFFSFDVNQRKMAEAAGLKLNPMPKRP